MERKCATTPSALDTDIGVMTTASPPARLDAEGDVDLGGFPAARSDGHRSSAVGLLGVFGLGAAVGLWVLWRTGPGKVPFLDLFEAAARGWPRVALAEDSQYILREPLGPIFYQLLRVHGDTVFLGLHAGCLLVSGALLATWLCRRLGLRSGLAAAMIVALTPVTAVLLLWIGIYDAFSILVWVLVLVSLGRQAGWQVAAGALAGFQNFEQVAVGLLLVALIPQLARSARLRPRVAYLLGGAISGKLVLEAYLRGSGAGPGSRVDFLARWDVFSSVLGSSSANAPLLLWSALAGLWGFAAKALYDSWGGWSPRQHTGVVLAGLVWFGTAALSADHTRVLTMTSFPLVVMGAMAIVLRWPDLPTLIRLPQTWLLVLAPPVVLLDYATVPMGIKPGTWGVWIF